jgi:hypothetical protein
MHPMAYLLFPFQPCNYFIFPCVVRIEFISRNLLVRALFVTVFPVGQDQGVFSFFVLEVITDAFFLEKAGYKMKIGLVILDAILPIGVTLLQVVPVIFDTVVFKYFFNYFGDGKVLKYLAIRGAVEQPEGGRKCGTVAGESLAGLFIYSSFYLSEPSEYAVDVTFFIVRQLMEMFTALPIISLKSISILGDSKVNS